MIAALLLAFALLQGSEPWPQPPGTIAQTCGAAGCAFLALQKGEVHGILALNPGSIDSDRDFGRYLGAARHLVPKTEAPIRVLRTANGWTVVVTAVSDEDAFVFRVRFINRRGRVMNKFDLPTVLHTVRAGAIFGGTDQIVLLCAGDPHPYTDLWWAFLLPDNGRTHRGYPELVGQGNGRIYWAGAATRGGSEAGLIVERQHPVDGDANRVLTITEDWNWDPGIPSLILGPH
ncbi:MAG: hypothetical protein ACRD2F_04785 [Terriglobales bacterium]